MTPLLAIRLRDAEVPEDLYNRMNSIYNDYNVESITAVIGKIRAEKVLAEIDAETLNILYETAGKSTKNVNQGPEKKPRRKVASKTHTEQDH